MADLIERGGTFVKDVRDMTVRELCALADEVRRSRVGSPELRIAVERMARAGGYLSESGALVQMGWWRDGPPSSNQ